VTAAGTARRQEDVRSESTTSGGPLQGVRVLDLSWLLPGPFFTGIFADLGADVLKVERPGDGDYTRALLPGMFRLANRGKRSAVLDLRHDGGRDAVLQLAARADVFVEGFRPGVMGRLGVGYEDIRKVNPGIVYVSLSGYGQAGAAAQVPGHDVNYCGRAGLMGIPATVDQGKEAPRMQLPVSDIAGAMYAAVSTLAALRERDRTGEGQWLDVSLTRSALAWSAVRWADAPADGDASWRHVNPANAIFKAADGVRLGVALVEPHFWSAFLAGLDANERSRLNAAQGDPLVLHEVLVQVFRARPSTAWLAFAAEHDLPISRIAERWEDVQSDPLFSGDDVWIRGDASAGAMPAYPVPMRGLRRNGEAPGYGEASDAVATLWAAPRAREGRS
jgi:crotonobetainyl-CoA:carnitine CoA-transferase CaiB-like acyl-CoA transferase